MARKSTTAYEEPNLDEEIEQLKAEERAAEAATEALKAARKAKQAAQDVESPSDRLPESVAAHPIFAELNELNGVKVQVNRVYSPEHRFATDKKPTFTGYLETLELDDCTEDRIKDRYGGGKYRMVARSKKGRYVTSATINIAGPAKNPKDLIPADPDETEDDEQDSAEDVPMWQRFSPWGTQAPNPYFQPPWAQQKDDTATRILEKHMETSASGNSALLQRLEAEREREEKRRERDEERWERERREEKERYEREVREREKEKKEDRERWERERREEKERYDREMKERQMQWDQQFKLEMTRLERQEQQSQRMMEMFLKMNKPDSMMQMFGSLFSGAIELAKTSIHQNNEDSGSLTNQILGLAQSVAPAVIEKFGPPKQPPALQGQGLPPGMTPEQLQQHRHQAYMNAVQSCPPGGRVVELPGHVFAVVPPDGSQAVIPQQPPKQAQPSQEAPAEPTRPYVSKTILRDILARYSSRQEPFDAFHQFVDEDQISPRAKQDIAQIYENTEPSMILWKLIELLSPHEVHVPGTFSDAIGSERGLEWITKFLYSSLFDSAEEAQRTWEHSEAQVDEEDAGA